MMKFVVPAVAAVLGTIQLGLALADTRDEEPALVPSTTSIALLAEEASKALKDPREARKLLSGQHDRAIEEEDLLMANCLERYLEALDEALAKAEERLSMLRAASDIEDAKRHHVVISVMLEKMSLTVREAYRCIGAEGDEVVTYIETIVPPDSFGDDSPFMPGFGDGEHPSSPPTVEPPPLAVPPPLIPVDVPPMLGAASSTR